MIDKYKNINIEEYTYDLPNERIAKYPLADRDKSKLLIYSEAEISENIFSNLPDIINENQIIVFNNTKVIHARLIFKKSTGAAIEIFCLEPLSPLDYYTNFATTKECVWKCMVGNLKKWKDEIIECPYKYLGREHILKAEKISVEQEISVKFSWDTGLSFSEIIETCGSIPIPPYLNRDTEKEDNIRYQTVYSKYEGSVAAPTAGLHFTDDIIKKLKDQKNEILELTLHVGAGTFKPVKSQMIGGHFMHREFFTVPINLLKQILKGGKEIIAVGTTSVRTLESVYWMGVKLLMGKEDFLTIDQWEVYEMEVEYSLKDAFSALIDYAKSNNLDEISASTTIIILPGYKFKVVSSIFTNFHQPNSTLLLLIAAAIGDDWRKVYKYAMNNNFRFLSYGDSSFLKINR